MSYGHGPALAGNGATAGDAGESCQSRRRAAVPNPSLMGELLRRSDIVAALAVRNMGMLYRALRDHGMSQRRIAALTGQSQSEVSEILKGRQVMVYDVLVRISDGLGIPRELMGLSWCGPDGASWAPDGAYSGDVRVADDVDDEMLRRHLLALGATATFGGPVEGLGQLLDGLADMAPMPLPARLGNDDVARVRDLTRRLSEASHGAASDPEVISAAVAWASTLLAVPGASTVEQALMVALAELRIEAGWAAFDRCLYRRAMRHYAHALELATETGDAYCKALALNYAGLATMEAGHPDDGLKMLQCGQVSSWSIPANEHRAVVVGEIGRPAVEASGLVEMATTRAALADAGADTDLARARDLWTPALTDPYGDLDRPAARLELDRGRLDRAEQFAAASMRRWEGGSPTSRTQTSIVLATIYVRAGEPRGPVIAQGVITDAARLTSVRARRQLVPLATALESRPGGEYQELARRARAVAV